MEQTNAAESDLDKTSQLPREIQFEIVEEDLLAITRPTVQLYEQA